MAVAGFPEDFTWGVATSAFQIEGATDHDRRGASIWDRFCKKPGAVLDGSDGRVACDHYARWRDDVELMRWLGVDAYRFSVAWPRVIPEGRGAVNQAGLDFYDALVDGLLEAGITPWITLYHWDLPQALFERGGWASRATVDAFVVYADVVARRLGDRVKHWITHNEPWCVAIEGHVEGTHAPGHRNWPEALQVAHHVLLSHGRAVPALRAAVDDAVVGITLNLTPAHAAEGTAEALEAARAADGRDNRWFLDPIFGRGYPDDAIADRVHAGDIPSGALPFVEPGDLETIAVPNDFLGINYYTRQVYGARPTEPPKTDIGWEIHADSLRAVLERVHAEYRPAQIVITENGAAYDTPPSEDGRVHDEARRAYLESHLEAAARALAAGVPLTGYFLWSLLDNFEWAEGYTQRFGAVWVDFETQQRIPKDSAHWYRSHIAACRRQTPQPSSRGPRLAAP